PAIAASLEALPDGALAHVYVLVEDESEHQPLVTKADARVRWWHRSRGDDLPAAVREAEWPDGQVHAFVHGEAGFVRDIRRHLLRERGAAKEWTSISGYWRLGADDERRRGEKAAERAAEAAAASWPQPNRRACPPRRGGGGRAHHPSPGLGGVSARSARRGQVGQHGVGERGPGLDCPRAEVPVGQCDTGDAGVRVDPQERP